MEEFILTPSLHSGPSLVPDNHDSKLLTRIRNRTRCLQSHQPTLGASCVGLRPARRFRRDSCADDIARAGWLLLFYEKGGFDYRFEFSLSPLLLDIGIGSFPRAFWDGSESAFNLHRKISLCYNAASMPYQLGFANNNNDKRQ
jgi:hypothetical protein